MIQDVVEVVVHLLQSNLSCTHSLLRYGIYW